LFHSLRGLDLRVENFVETQAAPGISQWSLNVNTPEMNFRVRAQGFETTFLNPGREISPVFRETLDLVERGMLSVLDETRVLLRNFTYNAHFELPPGEYQRLTGSFSGKPPDGLGVHAAQGMSFYFHSPESRDVSSVILDRSAVIADGLYFQVGSRFAVEESDLTASFSNFRLILSRAIEAINLGGVF
jgi:hypothetical protein